MRYRTKLTCQTFTSFQSEGQGKCFMSQSILDRDTLQKGSVLKVPLPSFAGDRSSFLWPKVKTNKQTIFQAFPFKKRRAKII